MALTAAEVAKFDSQNIVAQEISLATEVKANQDNITGILAGTGITLPTSDPGVAGQLWADSATVKVSAGS